MIYNFLMETIKSNQSIIDQIYVLVGLRIVFNCMLWPAVSPISKLFSKAKISNITCDKNVQKLHL